MPLDSKGEQAFRENQNRALAQPTIVSLPRRETVEDTDKTQHEQGDSSAPPPQVANLRLSQTETQATEDVFNPSSAAQRLGGERLLRKIVLLFLDNVPNVLKEINDSIANSDSTKLERSAHSLASSLAYLSAKLASDAALSLEQMGRESDFSRATSACEQLHAEIERLKVALAAFVLKEDVSRES